MYTNKMEIAKSVLTVDALRLLATKGGLQVCRDGLKAANKLYLPCFLWFVAYVGISVAIAAYSGWLNYTDMIENMLICFSCPIILRMSMRLSKKAINRVNNHMNPLNMLFPISACCILGYLVSGIKVIPGLSGYILFAMLCAGLVLGLWMGFIACRQVDIVNESKKRGELITNAKIDQSVIKEILSNDFVWVIPEAGVQIKCDFLISERVNKLLVEDRHKNDGKYKENDEKQRDCL